MKRPFRQGDSTSDSRRPRPSQGHRSFRGGDEGRPSYGAGGAGRYDSRGESAGGGGEQDRGGGGGWSPRPRSTYRREGASGGWNQSSGRPPQRDFNRPQRDFSPRSSAPTFNNSRAAAPEASLVSAENLKKGIKSANRAIADMLEEFGKGICGDYDFSGIELPVSFSADGRFLGFGKGGSVTINLTMTPLEADDVFEQLGSGETENIEDAEEEVVAILSDELDDSDDLELENTSC